MWVVCVGCVCGLCVWVEGARYVVMVVVTCFTILASYVYLIFIQCHMHTYIIII